MKYFMTSEPENLQFHKLLIRTNSYYAHRSFMWTLQCFFQTCIKFHWSIKFCPAFPGLMRWNKARVLAYFTRTHPLILDHQWFFMTSARLILPSALYPTHLPTWCLPNNCIKCCLSKYSVLTVCLVCMAKKRLKWVFY